MQDRDLGVVVVVVPRNVNQIRLNSHRQDCAGTHIQSVLAK